MLLKIVSLFLIAMLVLALFGRLRVGGWRIGRPGRGDGARTRRDTPARPATCPACGAYVIGRGPCACGAGRGGG